MSTMGREKYKDQEDWQPPMCGGIVFNKFRPKVHEKKKRSQEVNLFKAFDQRPVMTDSRSATSSNASSDENQASPETALLAEKSSSKRGSGKLIPLKDFVQATTVDLSSLQNQEILRSEFFMEEKGGKDIAGMLTSSAVEFDPNDVHQLRGKHIRSKWDTQKSIQPSRELSINSPPPFSPKPPKSPKSSIKAFSSPILLAQNDAVATTPQPSPRVPDSPTWNPDIASQQQEAFDMISSQNIYYRNKLGSAQKSYRKLMKEQTNQAEVIDKLKLEKETFQAETLLLREEMKAIRQQLEMFQQLLKQQTPAETMANAPVLVQPEESKKVSPRTHAVPEEAVVLAEGLDESTKYAFPSDFLFEDPVNNNVEESGGKSDATDPDPAENYWKREWELSMKEMGQVENLSAGKEATDPDENSDPFFGISKLSPANNATAAPVRGVDPPEVKRTSVHVRKSTPQKPATEFVTKTVEHNKSLSPKPTYDDDKDYEDDIKYVQELMQKYQHQFILQEPSLSHDERDLYSSVKGSGEPEKIFEIENMADVDREYSQRQEEMARLRAAFERGDLDDSIQDSRVDENPRKEPQPGEKKQLSNSQAASIQSFKHGKNGIHEHKHPRNVSSNSSEDFPAYPMPMFLRSMRLQDPTIPRDPSEHGSATRESRQDQSDRSERSRGMECQRDISQHSNDTEYADQIDHSTSHHNALLWSHPIEERDPPPHGERRESPELEKSTKGERHISLMDVMEEGEEESSEQTLAEIRDPGRNGRRGATYKIKMSSGSSQRRQKASEDEATMPTNQDPQGKALQVVVNDRKSLSRRLI